MKVFLDDFRIPLDAAKYMHTRVGSKNPIYLDKWEVVRNYDEFVKVVSGNFDFITHVSFDHDLADEHYATESWEQTDLYLEKTGLDCAKWLKNFYQENQTDLPEIFIHSMNPVGTENIKNVFL